MNSNYNWLDSRFASLFNCSQNEDYECHNQSTCKTVVEEVLFFKSKNLLFLLMMLLSTFLSIASGPTDPPTSAVTTCGSAIAISPASLPITGQALVCGTTNDLSAASVPVACGGASNNYKGGNESLYTLTPTASGNYTISISGQSWTGIFVYQGCPTSGGTCVGSIGNSSTSKNLVVNLTAGNQYYIWFDTWPTPNSPCAGTFSIALPVPPAPGESCATAEFISVAANVGASTNTLLTTGLTADGPVGGCSDATGNSNKRDRWIKFVAPMSGNKVVITTSSGTITDALLQVWSACPATGIALGCSDDVNGLMPELSFCANQYTPGATYYVQVWPYSDVSGNFNLKIYEDTACPVPPSNNECAAIQTLTVQTAGNCPANAVTGTTVNATASAGVAKTTCDSFGTYLDVFYKFNSGANTSLNFAFTSLTGVCEFGIYSGCGTGYLNVCSSSNLSTTLTGVTPNTDYYIVVWSNSIATQGTFSLCISQLPAPNCVAAPISPANGGTTCVATNFSWAAVANATAYDVYIDNVLVSDNQTATNYSQSTLAGAHTWRVVPSNSTGEATACTDFTFTTTATPIGDAFATAIDLGLISTSSVSGNTLSSSCFSDNFNSTTSPGSVNASTSNDVFYKFNITDCGTLLNVNLCGSDYDTYLHILNSSGVSVGFNDDSCGLQSSIAGLALAPGQYYVVVEGFSSNSGNYTLNFSYTPGTPQITLYADTDADGFGNPSVSITSCAAALTGYVSNSLDCNDSQLNYEDLDTDGYGSSIFVACGGSLLTGDCADTNPAINPGAVDVCYDGIDNDCNGIIDNACTPIVTTLTPGSCGVTLAGWYSTVTANGVSFAQGYRFRITKVDSADTPIGPSVDYDRPVSNISLSNVVGVTYNSRYRFEVAVRYNNVWQPFFGAACYINTPTATSTIALCGSTLTSINQWITTTAVANISSYKFRVTQLDGSLNPVGLSQEITQSANKFNMTQFAGYLYGTTYRVEVSLRNTDGIYLPYNTPCNITTPAHPTTQLQASQCNTVATSNTQLIYANAVSGATAYMFRVSYVVPGDPGNQLNYNMTYTNNAFNRFTLSNFPGLQAGITYSVEVSVKLATQPGFGPYGAVCTITTPGAVVIFKGADIKALELNTASSFEAVAYPNPFAENFKLNVTTASQESITVSVYDMLGKQVESRKVNSSEIESFEVGNNYPSGVYNVIVSQGVETKTLRVIKR